MSAPVSAPAPASALAPASAAAVADPGVDPAASTGATFPGDPLHAADTAKKTSHAGARTLLLYYA